MGDPAFGCESELAEKLDAYIASVDVDDITGHRLPYSMAGFACFCGIDKATVSLYASGHYDDNDVSDCNFSKPLNKFRAETEHQLISKALLGGYKEGMAKFLLAANHGYKNVESDSNAPPKIIELVVNVRGIEQEIKEVYDPETLIADVNAVKANG